VDLDCVEEPERPDLSLSPRKGPGSGRKKGLLRKFLLLKDNARGCACILILTLSEKTFQLMKKKRGNLLQKSSPTVYLFSFAGGGGTQTRKDLVKDAQHRRIMIEAVSRGKRGGRGSHARGRKKK